MLQKNSGHVFLAAVNEHLANVDSGTRSLLHGAEKLAERSVWTFTYPELPTSIERLWLLEKIPINTTIV